jgi:hypothetical protein
VSFWWTWLRILACIKHLPRAAAHALVVQSLNFLGWSCLFYYG